MARIAGVNIPDRKQAWLSLMSIYGVGRTTAYQLCASAEVDARAKVKDLTEEELDKLRADTLASINLDIHVTGVAGNDFPCECRLEGEDWQPRQLGPRGHDAAKGCRSAR